MVAAEFEDELWAELGVASLISWFDRTCWIKLQAPAVGVLRVSDVDLDATGYAACSNAVEKALRDQGFDIWSCHFRGFC